MESWSPSVLELIHWGDSVVPVPWSSGVLKSWSPGVLGSWSSGFWGSGVWRSGVLRPDSWVCGSSGFDVKSGLFSRSLDSFRSLGSSLLSSFVLGSVSSGGRVIPA